MTNAFNKTMHALEIGGTPLKVAAIARGGMRTPIVFLHGFGSTKEDDADIGHQPAFASALYTASLRHKVYAGVVRGIFTSMVELSDHGGLMDKFLELPCPKMYMYGEQNRTLSYLGDIETKGVRLAEITYCGHFPMYSNPAAMWQALAGFIGDG